MRCESVVISCLRRQKKSSKLPLGFGSGVEIQTIEALSAGSRSFWSNDLHHSAPELRQSVPNHPALSEKLSLAGRFSIPQMKAAIHWAAAGKTCCIVAFVSLPAAGVGDLGSLCCLSDSCYEDASSR